MSFIVLYILDIIIILTEAGLQTHLKIYQFGGGHNNISSYPVKLRKKCTTVYE